jgi:O-acetyl-ADP-ribose deacetylase (regulator of RNase III)
MLKYIDGNLITLALEGKFDVIAHGCNCFCQMKSGIAPQMASTFGCNDFNLEQKWFAGDINKLGQIDYRELFIYDGEVRYYPDYLATKTSKLIVINAYTQFYYNGNNPNKAKAPVDYDAITLCMRKIKHKFNGLKIGLPKIGSKLAGGDWNIISNIIDTELSGEDVTIINFKP